MTLTSETQHTSNGHRRLSSIVTPFYLLIAGALVLIGGFMAGAKAAYTERLWAETSLCVDLGSTATAATPAAIQSLSDATGCYFMASSNGTVLGFDRSGAEQQSSSGAMTIVAAPTQMSRLSTISELAEKYSPLVATFSGVLKYVRTDKNDSGWPR